MKPDTNATPTAQPGGLASVDQIVELADHLSACADQLHERIMRDIKSYNGKPIPAAQQDAARALLDDEVVLRQRANGLYADAAASIVGTLGKSQQHIIALTADAAEKIRKIAVIGDVTGLVAGLLALAGAASTGQPVAVVAALEKIRTHAKAIETTNTPPKPA
jgi:citrate synthase